MEDEFQGEEYGGESDEFEDPEEKMHYISSIIAYLINKAIPEKPRALTLQLAGKCLRNLGKIWNLSEYPPSNYISEVCSDTGKKLMDMEGYVDDYQYLHIEAVDLALTDVSILPQHFMWLISVNLSGNRLNEAKASSVTKLPNLVALKLNRNQIRDPFLPAMKHLQYLGLGSNKIRSMCNIYHPNLETLELNYNLIEEVEADNCWKHTKLKQLELRGNKLKTTSGIEYSSLVNLYLAQNSITELKGLEILVNLQRLHLRENPLTELTGFSQSNQNLKYLNIRRCQISSVEEIRKLSVLKGLRELVVKGNDFNPELGKGGEGEEEYEDEQTSESESGESEDEYDREMRIMILTFLPDLTRIDKKPVTIEERAEMREVLYRDD